MFHGLYISSLCYTILRPWAVVGILVVGFHFEIEFDCLDTKLVVRVALFLQEVFGLDSFASLFHWLLPVLLALEV